MAATMPTVYAHSHVAMPIATRLTRRIALYDNTTATLFSGLFLLTSGLGYNSSGTNSRCAGMFKTVNLIYYLRHMFACHGYGSHQPLANTAQSCPRTGRHHVAANVSGNVSRRFVGICGNMSTCTANGHVFSLLSKV